jgi:hypothetical protein
LPGFILGCNPAIPSIYDCDLAILTLAGTLSATADKDPADITVGIVETTSDRIADVIGVTCEAYKYGDDNNDDDDLHFTIK